MSSVRNSSRSGEVPPPGRYQVGALSGEPSVVATPRRVAPSRAATARSATTVAPLVERTTIEWCEEALRMLRPG